MTTNTSEALRKALRDAVSPELFSRYDPLEKKQYQASLVVVERFYPAQNRARVAYRNSVNTTPVYENIMVGTPFLSSDIEINIVAWGEEETCPYTGWDSVVVPFGTIVGLMFSVDGDADADKVLVTYVRMLEDEDVGQTTLDSIFLKNANASVTILPDTVDIASPNSSVSSGMSSVSVSDDAINLTNGDGEDQPQSSLQLSNGTVALTSDIYDFITGDSELNIEAEQITATSPEIYLNSANTIAELTSAQLALTSADILLTSGSTTIETTSAQAVITSPYFGAVAGANSITIDNVSNQFQITAGYMQYNGHSFLATCDTSVGLHGPTGNDFVLANNLSYLNSASKLWLYGYGGTSVMELNDNVGLLSAGTAQIEVTGSNLNSWFVPDAGIWLDANGTSINMGQTQGVIAMTCNSMTINGSPAGLGYAGLSSTTSRAIGTGSKAFTVNQNASTNSYTVGTRVRAIYTSDVTQFMEGTITAYSGTSLTVNVDVTSGSGTYASWAFTVAGIQGATGATGATGDPAETLIGTTNSSTITKTWSGLSGDVFKLEGTANASGSPTGAYLVITFNNDGNANYQGVIHTATGSTSTGYSYTGWGGIVPLTAFTSGHTGAWNFEMKMTGDWFGYTTCQGTCYGRDYTSGAMFATNFIGFRLVNEAITSISIGVAGASTGWLAAKLVKPTTQL